MFSKNYFPLPQSTYFVIAPKTWEFHFSLDWVKEFSILFPFLVKGKVFSDNSNLSNLVNVQNLHEYELNVFPTEFTLCLKNIFVVPHCFVKMFHLQQS